ncbi:PAS domain S-box protein [Echinicola soli]|uniref:histidine kinase n=1 Tax=Echinicola soli TaxID=2591634 RepID=A0A514CN06_9BACT|nr:PAS domain S-box protein [Echinicola soli]QDH81213.1 PAS domain S-box protein [Echinicola soli]
MSTSSPEPKKPDQVIFDQSPFPMWIYDLDTYKFLAVNKEATIHYGYSENEFLNMTLRDIRPTEDIELLEEAVTAARKRSKFLKGNLFRHQKKDGTIIQVKIKSNPIHYHGKHAEIVSAIDLTETYQQQQHIEKQKRYLVAIGEFQEILLKSKDWPNALKKCFEVIGELLGPDRLYFFPLEGTRVLMDGPVSWPFGKTSPQEVRVPSRLVHLPRCKKLLEKGKPFSTTISQLSDPGLRSVLARQGIKSIFLLPVMMDNEPVGTIGVEGHKEEKQWQDLDLHLLNSLSSNLSYAIKEEASYKKLEESETKFRSLVQNGTDLIALIDGNGNYKYVAPTSTKILGRAPESFMGKNAFEFIFPDDITRVTEQLKALEHTDHVSVDPYRFADAQGNWAWLHTELSNHLNDPSINGIIANTQVVTEQMEKRMTSDMVASMTNAIGHPGALNKGISRALAKVIQLPDIDYCETWLISKDRLHLNLVSKCHTVPGYAKLYKESRLDSLAFGEGLPGTCWAANATKVWDNLPQEPVLIRKKQIAQTALQSAFSIPISYNNNLLGVFLGFSTKKAALLKSQIRLLKAVFEPIGAVIQQKLIEEEYKSFFDLSPGPLCVIGFDGLIKKYNKALLRLLGYSKKELLQEPLLGFVYKNDNGLSLEKMTAFLGGKTNYPLEAKLLTKTGRVRTLIWKGKPIPESKIIIAVAKDITEQKNAENDLTEAYTKLKTAQKIGKLGYWSRDFGADVSEWSEETYKIYGYSPKDFKPTMENLIKTFHPEDRYLLEHDPTKSLKPGKVTRFQHRIINGKGKVKWVQQELRLVSNREGKPVRIEGAIRDITEQKEHEQKLSISNNRFKLAMKVSNEMIWELDHSTGSIIRGTRFGKDVGYKETESFSKKNSWFQKVHPEDSESVWQSFQRSLQNKTSKSWKREYRLLLEDDRIVYVVDRCLILRNETGSPVRSVGSVLDVTFSRKQLARIQQQNKNLREIAWLQSHQIRAPLSRIMGLISISKEADTNDGSLEQILEWIDSSCKELDKVVHEITERTFDNPDDNNT